MTWAFSFVYEFLLFWQSQNKIYKSALLFNLDTPESFENWDFFCEGFSKIHN